MFNKQDVLLLGLKSKLIIKIPDLPDVSQQFLAIQENNRGPALQVNNNKLKVVYGRGEYILTCYTRCHEASYSTSNESSDGYLG